MFWFNKKEKERKEALRKALSEPVDTTNIFSAISKRDEISRTYKSICRITHPDRFIGSPQKMAIAEQLFKDAQTHKTDLHKLTEIQQLAIEKLGGEKI